MINPDIEKIILIPETELNTLNIETALKIKKENTILKSSIIIMITIATIVVLSNIIITHNDKSKENSFK
ncbi:MAG TPA: hypothetical protein VK164_03890 [Flavobacterium sp.]|uniref:hypothetical protein n=1 Tax=Flavobacterium sp. TaxID=239 RepID=UPI002B4AB206|nr:hypothetical protein [Flavobacterium sp.]HLO73056.1 hypothetical protein [Flavobacterium sp.]